MSAEANQFLDQIGSPPQAELPILKRGMNYSHKAMIDLILARPGISQNEIAAFFGYTASWISRIQSTDAFQTALAARREEILDPVLRATVEERTRGLYLRSLEILEEKLNADASAVPDQLALQVYKESARAAGYGVKPPTAPSEGLAQSLVDHSNRLVNLLRTTKAMVRSEETVDGEVIPQG